MLLDYNAFWWVANVHDFIYPQDTASEATSTIVVMDEVLRQNNPEFLSGNVC